MIGQKQPRRQPPRRWVSLQVNETRSSYVLQTRPKHDDARKTAETVMCGTAALLLVVAYLMLLLPQALLVSSVGMPEFLFPMLMVTAALGIYAVATRGHAPEVRYDKARHQIWICSRNSNGDARVQTRLSKSDIQSIFIKRPENKRHDAEIVARLKGKARPVCLVRGRLDEIEVAMKDLCAVLRAESLKPARQFSASVTPRRVFKKARVGALA